MLILAGVSIATLTGDNGILTKANTAKIETQKANAEEQIKITVIASYDQNGNLDINKLKTELGKIQGNITITYTNEGFPVKVTIDGYTFEIDNKGNVVSNDENQNEGEEPEVPTFNPEDLTIEAEAQNTDKYGRKVTNYTVTTEYYTSGVWRLFYQDSNYTYLITDGCVGTYKPSNYYTNYTNGADVSKVGQKLSPIISSLFTSTNTSFNIRTTAWLTDTSDTGMWSDYKNSDATFAIGSPTAELFAASYNATGKSNTITLGLGTYGYTHNMQSGWLSVKDNYGIYNKSAGTHWWIASPFNRNGHELFVLSDNDGSGYFNSYFVQSNSFSVRPVVCISTSLFNSKYLTSLVDE